MSASLRPASSVQNLRRPIGVEKMIGKGDQSRNVTAICGRFGESEVRRLGLAEHGGHVGTDGLRPVLHQAARPGC